MVAAPVTLTRSVCPAALTSVSSVEPASKVTDPCTDSVPMELPAAIVPLLVTAPTIVPLPPSLASGSTVTRGLVSVPLTLSRPVPTKALVEKVPAPVSVQSEPCMESVSKFRNFAIDSLPVPSRTRLSVAAPPRTLPLRVEPVRRRTVCAVALPPPDAAKSMA